MSNWLLSEDEYLAQVAHDMRNPISAILGLVQLCRQEEGLSETVRSCLDNMEKCGSYLRMLTDNLLETGRTISLLEKDVLTPVWESMIPEYVRALISGPAGEAGVDFQIRTEGCADKCVLMDGRHVLRVLVNLLSNGVKYTPSGGTVSLVMKCSYQEDTANYTFVVADTGIGMSKEFQEKMFRAFERKEETEQAADGAGLGMFICKSLIRQMGGTLLCSSELGKGTTFTLNLSFKLAPEELWPLHQTDGAEPDGVSFPDKRVLVAEDNETSAQVTRKMLSLKGIKTEWAKDGSEAIHLLRSKGAGYYNAIIMDVMMPVMDGCRTAALLRQDKNRALATLPVIGFTAGLDPKMTRKCMSLGMNVLLTKPVDPPKLYKTLADMFEEQEIIDDLFNWGADPAQALERIGNDRGIYIQLTTRLSVSRKFEDLFGALRRQEYQEAWLLAHDLLGSTTMLGITPVAKALESLREPLKNSQKPSEEMIERIRKVWKEYKQIAAPKKI